jgi:hypothetical protein
MAEKKGKKKGKTTKKTVKKKHVEKVMKKPVEKTVEEEVKPEELEVKLSLPPINLMLVAVLFFAFGFLVSYALNVNFIGGDSAVTTTLPAVTTTTRSSTVTTTLPSASNPIKTIVLNDKRCADCILIMQSILPQLQTLFPEMDVEEFDYISEEGKNLYTTLNLEYLPAILFDDTIKDAGNYNTVQTYLEEKDDYLSLRIGATFDPTAEICDNNIDDNRDNLVDCDDPTCASKLVCNKDAIAECVKPYNITPDTVIFYHSNQCGWCAKMKPGVENLQSEGYSFYWAEASDAGSMEVITNCVSDYMTSGGVPQFICVKNGVIKVGAFTDENSNLDEATLKKFADDCIAS